VDTHQITVLILFPKSSSKAKDSTNPYGTYQIPGTSHIHNRRQQIEEPITGAEPSIADPGTSFSTAAAPALNATLPKVVPSCFSSLDTCISSTNNCSGHGACIEKYSGDQSSCFACVCVDTFESVRKNTSTYNVTTSWGGGACQKIDVSAPFWLIFTFTIVIVAVLAWAIGMMFSIGEEKLPGVISAGVSNTKGR